MHSRYFLGILQFGHSESWELSGEWLAGSLLWKHWSATKIADLESAGTEGTFCAEYMEEILDVSAQRKIAGRSNKMCTAWCLYDKYGGSLDESQILCLQFQRGSDFENQWEEGMTLQFVTTWLFYLDDFMKKSIFLEASIIEIQYPKATDSCSDESC